MKQEKLHAQDLVAEKYRGIRPAFGYPACPDHTPKTALFELLQAPQYAGVTLTESMAMMPASSVSGIYLNHPAAHYFAVGKIRRDQVEDIRRAREDDVRAGGTRVGAECCRERRRGRRRSDSGRRLAPRVNAMR